MNDDDAQGHSDTFPPGTVLAGTPHLVRRELGRGGVGTVYETERLDNGERRAVKVLSSHAAGNPALEERLLLEAAGLGELRSRHIVGVRGVGRLTTGEAFYEMDLLEGETLRETLGYGPLEPAYACGLIYQALGALRAVHGAGLIHRDVKPDNLFWCNDGRCVLLDFGAVKVLTDVGRFPPRRFPTDKRKTFGTARYLPPEAGRSRAPDARADVFAAGAVLAELLAGEWAHEDLDERDYLEWVDAFGFPMPDGIPEGLRPVIERATASDPDKRYPSAAEFAVELGWACQDAGIDLVGVRPPPRRPVWPDPDETPDERTSSDDRYDATARASSDEEYDASVHEPSDEPPHGSSPAAPVRSRWTQRASLASAVALSVAGVAGVAAGATTSLTVSSWVGPPVALRVAPEPRRAAPAGVIAPTRASAASTSKPPAEPPPSEASPSAKPPDTPAPPAVSSSARASSARSDRRSQLEAKLRSGRGTTNDAEALAGLCRKLGDDPCLQLVTKFIGRGGAR